MNTSSLSNKLGLTTIGIAPAADLDDEYARLLDWLNHGYHGNMAWLAKSAKKRCSPSHMMAEPKSVIVCAMKYDDMPPKSSKFEVTDIKLRTPNSELPKYLLREDYHEIMMKKLEAVVLELKKEYPDARYKCHVDTGPVLEKAWGVRAGLGFIGKNTLLISPEHGSQMALGVVVTTANVGSQTSDFRPPTSDCGTCRACLDACPTKALTAPYILDARRCISYKYFIEKKEGGCDACQDACPFNQVP